MIRMTSLCFTALLVAVTTNLQAADSSWIIGSRSLPTPASVSEELHTAIALTPAPVVASRMDFPLSKAQWQGVITQRDAARGATSAGFAKYLGVTYSPDQIAGVNIYRVQPSAVDPRHAQHLFVHLHGGAYVYGNGEAGLAEALVIAARLKIPVLSIDYRMPPRYPFPAALDDVISVYQQLLKNYPANTLALGGTSAGGGLTLASTLKMAELGLQLPGALFLGTPWADVTKTGDSLYTNEGIDRVLVTYDGSLEAAALLYADGQDLKNPYISPIYGDFSGFPPTQLVTGTRDMFLSDTSRTHRKLRAAGVVADLNVYEGMSHAGYLLVANSAESFSVYADLKVFLLQHLAPSP